MYKVGVSSAIAIYYGSTVVRVSIFNSCLVGEKHKRLLRGERGRSGVQYSTYVRNISTENIFAFAFAFAFTFPL